MEPDVTLRRISAISGSLLGLVILLLALYLGIEEKAWYERGWQIVVGIVGGGSGGAILFTVIGGAIGFVSGPLIYGSVGLPFLITIGSLGGAGVGGIINMIQNPSDYDYDIPLIFAGTLLAMIVGVIVNAYLPFALKKYISLAKS